MDPWEGTRRFFSLLLSFFLLLSQIPPLPVLAQEEIPPTYPLFDNTENAEGVIRLLSGCTRGAFVSEVLEVGEGSWRLSWEEEEPGLEEGWMVASEVSLQVRVSGDGESWSEWMGPGGPGTFFTSPSADLSLLPPFRYLQYRVLLSSDSPELSGPSGPKWWSPRLERLEEGLWRELESVGPGGEGEAPERAPGVENHGWVPVEEWIPPSEAQRGWERLESLAASAFSLVASFGKSWARIRLGR